MWLLFLFSLFRPPFPDSLKFNGVLEGLVKYSYSSPARYFLNFGYYDVARAEGMVGFYLNPASLYKAHTLEIGITAIPPKSSYSELNIGLSNDIFFPLGFNIPLKINSQEIGALDLFSIVGKFKRVGIGMGIMQGDIYDASFEGEGAFATTIDEEMEDYLTHSDIPNIPSGYSIPVRWIIRGEEVVKLRMEGSGRLETLPIFFGIAYDFDKIGLGMGFKWIRYNAEGNFKSHLEQAISNLTMFLEGMPEDWVLNLIVNGKGSVDSIWSNDCWGRISTSRPSFSLGAKFDFDDFLLGFVIEHYFYGYLKGDYGYIETIPTNLKSPEVTSSHAFVDTVNKCVSGSIGASFGTWDKSMESDSNDVSLLLPSQTALRLGASAKAKLMILGASLGAQQIGTRGGIGEIYFNTGMEYLSNPPLRIGFIITYKFYQLGDKGFSTLPIMSIGAGTTFSFKHFFLDMGLRMGSTTFPGRIYPLASLSIGCGLRYRL